MNFGFQLLAAYLYSGDTTGFIQAKLRPEFFIDDEAALFTFVSGHVANYKKLPDPETAKSYFKSLTLPPEPVLFYKDKLLSRYKHKTMAKALQTMAGNLEAKELAEAMQVMKATLDDLIIVGMGQDMVDYAQDGLGMVLADYKASLNPDKPEGIRLGWEYLDKMTNGLVSGDIVSIVGRPAAGKSFMLLYSAIKIWQEQNKSVLFVSMEMPISEINKRLAAIDTKTAFNQIKKSELSSLKLSQLTKTSKKNKAKDVSLWVIDGNLTATVDDVFSIASQMAVDVVILDGAYLMAHPNKKLDRYTRVAENIELVKKSSQLLKIPTICSFQFSREASKKSKKKGANTEAVGLEDIAYSDAIGQVSSVVLGLFEDDGIETIKRRKVSILKGRSGEVGEYSINWDFDQMDFAQCGADGDEELLCVD